MAIDVKQTIAEALFRLLEQEPVEKITVKALVESCGISRQGFYYHFQDIMDVIEWATAQAIQSAVDASLDAPTPEDALTLVILTLRKDRKLIRHLMASQRRSEIEQLLVRSARTYMEKMLRAKSMGLSVSAADLEMAVRYHSYALVGILMENLDDKVPPDIIAGQLCRLVSGDLWVEATGAR